MPSRPLDPPAPDELELSIFGPGYGEAIALHIGEGKWVLVDSCIEPDTKQPASLNYLHNLGIDIGKAVKLVVATHWHDDHVRGISDIFNECTEADFAISSALREMEFLTLVELYNKRSTQKSSGMDELARVFRVLQSRKEKRARFNPPVFASMDKLLYSDQIRLSSETLEVRIHALSPSDASILQAAQAFAQLLPQEGDREKRVQSPVPNLASVVLWVEVGNHKVLLGADLEKTSDPKTGWSVILSDSNVISGKASAFKIPHHGSENAHHKQVWSELLTLEPFAAASPWVLGGRILPTPSDVRRITHLTPHAYVTSPARRGQQSWCEKIVREFVQQATRRIQYVHHGWGHIRLRQKIVEPNGSWQVDLFGDAYALNTLSAERQ